jgi:uncharacterized protein
MLRLILLLILIAFVARAFWRLMDGVLAGVRGERPVTAGGSRSAAAKAVHMVRDPMCGTFVVPERAVTLATRDETHYFCSDRCRDAYRARENAGRGDAFRGRTA